MGCYIPARTRKKQYNYQQEIKKLWMTKGILPSIKQRERLLFKKCTGKHRDSTAYQKYLKHRNCINSLKRTTK